VANDFRELAERRILRSEFEGDSIRGSPRISGRRRRPGPLPNSYKRSPFRGSVRPWAWQGDKLLNTSDLPRQGIPARALVATDMRSTHARGRPVLRADDTIEWLRRPQAFEQELARPENAQFAAG